MSNEESVVRVADGKYEVRHSNGTGLRALRHGEPWRDLTGDGLVLALVHRIEELEEAATLRQQAARVDDGRFAAHPSGDGSIVRKGDQTRLTVDEILAAMNIGVGVDVTAEGAHVCVRQGDAIVYSQLHPAAPVGVPDGLVLDAEDWAVLRRLRRALPDVGLNGWHRGVTVLDKVLAAALSAQTTRGVSEAMVALDRALEAVSAPLGATLRAALSAQPAERVPEGMVLVPAEAGDADAFMVLYEYQQLGRTRKDAYRIAIRKLAERASAMLAASPAAPADGDGKPSDCSGDPSSCPDNEGHGCHCATTGAAR